MTFAKHHPLPLVSVIIPCYNHGIYLLDAFQSIWQQEYSAIEIIVVDDGSTDQTEEITKKSNGIKYIYQHNQGLSAARNTGIANSKGDFLVFLDADDWLLLDAIPTNVCYLLQNEQIAFVSGAHDKVFVDNGIIKEEVCEVLADHYTHLLQGNYIGMHATVMYRRWVFNEYSFDTMLRACEDYDLYLKIARKHPILHHTKKIAAYRLHSFNMSGNIPFMLQTVLQVLDRQQSILKTDAEKQAYKKGYIIWKEYYCNELYKKLINKKASASKNDIYTLVKNKPILGLRYILNSIIKC